MAYIARSSGRNEILLHRARLALLYPTGRWSALIAFLSMTAAAYAYELRWLAAVAALAGLALFLVFMVPVWFDRGWGDKPAVHIQDGPRVARPASQLWPHRGAGHRCGHHPAAVEPVALRKALLDAMDRRDRPSTTGPPNVAKSDGPIEQRAQS